MTLLDLWAAGSLVMNIILLALLIHYRESFTRGAP